jgi:hypothetical protein
MSEDIRGRQSISEDIRGYQRMSQCTGTCLVIRGHILCIGAFGAFELTVRFMSSAYLDLGGGGGALVRLGAGRGGAEHAGHEMLVLAGGSLRAHTRTEFRA